jgi:HlyD family secretion protein
VLPVSARATLPEIIARENSRRHGRRWLWAGVALALVLAVVLAVVLSRPKPVLMAARFRTANVTRGELVREVRATGTVEAVSTVLVGAEISGRVATVEVDYNQHVVAGQVLARFDLTALEAQRAQRAQSAAVALGTRAQLSQARSDLAQARSDKARADQLFAQHAQAVNEHEQAVTALSVAEARLASAEATLAAQTAAATIARTNLDHGVIRSPIDGVVITRAVDPGQTVASVMTTPVLFTIAADLAKMQVVAAVDEADIAAVAEGQGATFTVTAWPGRVFHGTVIEVRNAARIVQDVVTYGVLVQADNPDLALKPGMTASVKVRTGFAASTLQVPNGALLLVPPTEQKPTQPTVWTLQGEALVAHVVHPGLSDGEQTALGDGDLPAGAAVLIDLTSEGKKHYGLASK